MSRKGTSKKVNTFTMHGDLVRVLWLMVTKPGITTTEIGNHFNTNTVYCAYTKMKYFGLIWQERAGLWHPTSAAVDFLKGAITVPEVVYYYRDTVVRTEGRVHVTDLLRMHELEGYRKAIQNEVQWRTSEVQCELF